MTIWCIFLISAVSVSVSVSVVFAVYGRKNFETDHSLAVEASSCDGVADCVDVVSVEADLIVGGSDSVCHYIACGSTVL